MNMKNITLVIILYTVAVLLWSSTAEASDKFQGYYMSNGVEYKKCSTGICGSDGSKFSKYGNKTSVPKSTSITKCTRYGFYIVCK